ncbi:urease accessory protein [Kribbella antiqua]|uniref:Urease accessory protein n=1 Tax=Kribbella antiqua TaxID=2512217 RepID=A0A4R2IKF6_9ACTN|nr:urease accessory protein [Kribbella antiqua]
MPEAPKLRASEHPVPSRGFVLDVGSQDPRLSANSVEAAGESARLGVPDRAGLDVPQLPELQVSARPAPGAVEHSTREASEQSTPETASPEAPGSQASGSEASGSEASGSEASGAEPAGSGAEAGERSGAKVVERLGAEVAEGLGMVEGAWAARTPSQALRGASRRQGRVYLRLAARVWPEVLRYLPANGEVARPVVVGVIGAVNGLSAEQVARLIAYDDVQTVVAASLKLLPVDPADAACWLAGLQDDIERLVTDVAPLTEIEKIPANGAPLIDLFAQNHATERMRLFHA